MDDNLIALAMRAYKGNDALDPEAEGLEWLRKPLAKALSVVEPVIREDERIRMRDKAATATVTTTEDSLSVLNVDDPHGVDWTPVSIPLIRALIDNRNAEVAQIREHERNAVLKEEQDRMKALARLLLDSGDITPMAARLMSKGRDGDGS